MSLISGTWAVGLAFGLSPGGRLTPPFEEAAPDSGIPATTPPTASTPAVNNISFRSCSLSMTWIIAHFLK